MCIEYSSLVFIILRHASKCRAGEIALDTKTDNCGMAMIRLKLQYAMGTIQFELTRLDWKWSTTMVRRPSHSEAYREEAHDANVTTFRALEIEKAYILQNNKQKNSKN
ncbi:uncharacterized protein LOC125203230 [Salvia hispanica]|uniref:uncharacterized protein LOC125203230 n=1 Tax=Salvia hispanica TaxID=49212 RepID=UPI0020092956|nr:uncharacterized protein LOC125203230 [Salvia hispanica]